MLASRIGWTSPPRHFTVTAGQAARWAEAMEDPDPRWETEVPPTLLVSCRPDFWDDLFPELADVGSHWLNGGDRLSFSRPVPIGTGICGVLQITAIDAKRGRSGDLLLFATRTTFTTIEGEHLCTITGTIIRR
jgi:hypothetical protein